MSLFGAHVSIAGGVDKSPERAYLLGCDAMQIFSKNQRTWNAKPYSEEEIKNFKENVKRFHIQKVVIHASYLLNLATNDEIKIKKTLEALTDELKRGDQLEVSYFVIHPGSAVNMSEEEALENIVKNTDKILSEVKPKIKLLFEITAGQGNNIGYKFKHIKYLLDNIKNDNIGVCFDTCHAFAAGYDLKENYEGVFNEFDHIIGLDKLFVFHLNDSKFPLGSRKDRHENIGDGYIGLNFFEKLVNDSHFKTVPMILETPGGDEWYKKNLNILRRMING